MPDEMRHRRDTRPQVGSVVSFTIDAPEFFGLPPNQLLTGIVTKEWQPGFLTAVFYGPHAWVGYVEEYAVGLMRIVTHDGERFFKASKARFVAVRTDGCTPRPA